MKKHLLIATLALLGCGQAHAADLAYEPPPVEVVPFGGWYLRGHIGMSNQQLGHLSHPLFNAVEVLRFIDKGGFSSGSTIGVGAGYQFNDWIRGDGVIEYRGKADFAALDRYGHSGPRGVIWDGANDYTAKKSELLAMANAYVDVGDWYGIKPYVGLGLGASRNTISNFRDINVPMNGVAAASSASTWNLAWGLHAGLGYTVNERLTLDFGYSYLDLGDAKTGRLRSYDGTVNAAPMKFQNITSHDFKFGLRYALQ